VSNHQPMRQRLEGNALTVTVRAARTQRAAPGYETCRGDRAALVGEGERIEDLTSATGWLPHSTRAALTGLRKRGYRVERARSEEGDSFYRIVARGAPALTA